MARGRVGKTDIVGSTIIAGEGTITIPEGFKVVRYGAVKEGDYKRVKGEWEPVSISDIGKKCFLGTFMRLIE